MNSVLFEIGILQVKWYSFLILVGIILGGYLGLKEAKRKGMNKDIFIDVLFYGVLIGILGARIYYVLFNLDYYIPNPGEILQVWNGGLAIHGGVIAGAIFLYFYTKKKKINFWLLLDVMVVGLILAQAIGRWGNFFNGEAYGRDVTLEFLKNLHLPQFIIKGMYINGIYREPTFLYESILNLIGFIILISIRKIKQLKTGMIFSAYLVWYGITRCIIESFRSDSLMLGSIKVAQLISILGVILGIGLMIYSYKHHKYYKEDQLL